MNARALNPRLTIIARTKRLEDASSLTRAGASIVVAEEMKAAEEIITCLLSEFDMSSSEALEQIHKVRSQHNPAHIE